MGLLVVVLLLAAWAAVLVPSFGAKRFGGSPMNNVRSFEQFMGVLAGNTRTATRMPGRWVMVPPEATTGPKRRAHRIVRRRRLMFQRLALGAVFSLAIGIFVHPVLLAHLMLDVSLLLYVAQLRRWRLQRVAAARVVAAEAERTLDTDARIIVLDQAPFEPDAFFDDAQFERMAVSFR